MSGPLPVLSARDVLRALRKAGFIERRSTGSHRLLVDPDDPTRAVTVPVHGGRDLRPGTLRSIIRQSGLTVDEFRDLL